MSNRDALRKLSRKFPPPPEVKKIMASLKGGTDLSVAIMATAILDASLEKLITTKFKSRNRDLVGQIFLNRGPLSDFNSKTLVAQAFGIITPNMAQEMHSLRAIRNAFAHAKIPLSFDHEIIAKEVLSLRMLNAIQQVEKEADQKMDLSNKTWFLLTTEILLIMFDEIGNHHGTANDALGDILAEQPPASSKKS